MPIAWPFPESTVTSEFGETEGRNSPHGGIDFGVLGAIVATGDGVVTFNGWLNKAGGYSTRVRYDNGVEVLYCHMPKTGPCKAGTRVSPGTKLGEVGESGNAFGRHLHAETFVGCVRVNPRTVFGAAPAAPAGGGVGFSEATLQRQQWLNARRGEKLVPDGKEGGASRAAYGRYQTFLRAYGYTGAIDGKWGGGTQGAHARYWAEVHKPAPTKPRVSTASFGRVDVVQRALKTKYPLYAGKLDVDNMDGPDTQTVVKEFQKRVGLEPDGIAGPATRAKLGVA